MVSIVIGTKGVFTSLNLFEFLTVIKNFAAHVVIWSSMKRSIVEEIVDYIFHRLPRPFDILGQTSFWKD
jgi:hypothetical protein